MITIGNDFDLKEAIAWITQRNKTENTTKSDRIIPLHLVVMSLQTNTEIKPTDEPTNHLFGVTDLFLEQLRSLSLQTPTEDPPSSSYTSLMINTEWRGKAVYLDTSDSFPLVLRITKLNSKSIEGFIRWTTLDAITRWLGKTYKNNRKLNFTEYEAVCGEENVEVPNYYTCSVEDDCIKGWILESDKKNAKKVASLELRFAGIDTPKDGFLENLSQEESSTEQMVANKRKFDLHTNNNIEAGSYEDRINAFKKLTQNSVYWYQRVKPRDENPQKTQKPKTEQKVEYTKSCEFCMEPLVERVNLEGKKIYACAKYPRCYGTWEED
uniref:DNA topoisomerase type IA zn finger domain-containing protein n=1 Tax=Arcella intermedia TaxID=1963864 RepID=A0A6B2L7G2_9EUKA